MAIILNAKFRPFSYAELVAPLQDYAKAYKETEEAYSNLALQTEQWKNIVNQTQSPKAYEMYSKYANDLNNIVDDFSKGMTLQNRGQLLNMRKRYSSDIIPIANAVTRRKELADEQRKLNAQDPTRIWQHNANDISLDTLIGNPTADYGQSISGAALAAQVAAGASALAKEFRDNPEKLRKIAGGQYYEYIKQRGFSSKAVLDTIMNNPNASPILTNLVESTIKSSGITGWGNKQAIQRAYEYANQGLWKAVGEAQVQNLDNKEYMNPLQRLQYAKAVQEASEGNTTSQYRVNPLPLRSSQEIGKANKTLEKYINAGYLTRTNRGLSLTKKGMEQLRFVNVKPIVESWDSYKKAHPGTSRSSYDAMVAEISRQVRVPNVFAQWYNTNIGGYNNATNKVETPTTRLNKYEQSIKESSYDTYHTTEYDRQLDSSYGNDFMRQMWSAASTEDNNKVLYGTSFSKEKGWEKGKKYSKDDLKDYTVTNVRYSKYGNTAILQSKDGGAEVLRVIIPKGVHIGVERSITSAIANADYYGEILSKGMQPAIQNNKVVRDRSGQILYTKTPLTAADRAVLDNRRNGALQDLYSYGSQAVVPSKTKTEEINSWY